MLHILASVSFMLVALGASGLVAAMMLDSKEAILAALGMQPASLPRTARHSVRGVRTAGRWQSASAPAARPWRAAA